MKDALRPVSVALVLCALALGCRPTPPPPEPIPEPIAEEPAEQAETDPAVED